jgi:hypothetical protein
MCEAAARSRCLARAVVRSPAVPRSLRRSEPANIEQAAQYSDGPCPHRNASAPYGALRLRRLSCGNCAQRYATRAVAWTRQPRRVAGTAQLIRRTRGWRGGTLCASRARPEIRRGISRAIDEIAVPPQRQETAPSTRVFLLAAQQCSPSLGATGDWAGLSAGGFGARSMHSTPTGEQPEEVAKGPWKEGRFRPGAVLPPRVLIPRPSSRLKCLPPLRR